MKPVLYITTNNIWSGSEELWARSAKSLLDEGYAVAYASRFEHAELNKIKAPHVNFANRYDLMSIVRWGIKRFTKFTLPGKDVLKDFIQKVNPQLVVISQGNTFQGLEAMQTCGALGVPYVTITQLAADIFIWGFAEDKLPVLRQAYTSAKKNYFVSHQNLRLHNTMLGQDLTNAEVVYNPCKITDSEMPAYPEPDGVYDIGLVGRIDCWHKGYDFLLQIAGTEKWRQRPVRFNLYGSGPYLTYMKGIIKSRNLSNLIFKGHSNHISQVWRENQLLFMPSRMEGQALALIEAMYCRRAAVVTDVGGATELIEEGHSGFIADIPAVGSIDTALERAWEQRDRWKELGLNAGVALKEKYPADAVAYFNQKLLAALQ